MFIQRNTFSESLLKVDEPLYKVYHDSTLYGDGTRANPLKVIGGGGTSLPDQTGNIGKYLTTDGATLSWATVNALPSQTGNDGKFLFTDGTTATWSNPVRGISATVNDANITLNLTNAEIFNLTLNVSTTIAFTSPRLGTFVFRITQDGTGGKNVTWPVNVKWSGGIAPVLTTTANKTDIITLIYDGNNFYGAYVLNF